MEIVVDDPTAAHVAWLVAEHVAQVRDVKPPTSVHALGSAGLGPPATTFWSAWRDGTLVGCAALRELDTAHGEVKSVHTAAAAARSGVASALVDHVVAVARARGYRALLLETGSAPYFAPARRLYRRRGFRRCGPFGEYGVDDHNVYLRLALAADATAVAS